METIQFLPITDWGIGIKERPFLISGPCSAESEEQVINIAHQLKDQGVKVFRAGIWKPRTHPNGFEGVGEKGLAWLRKVKQETGMLIATEVANQRHAYEALKHGVDILWIGARTTANPFAMQEIANTIAGADVIVFVKNPVNPDLELWIGAVERIHQAGISRIGAIHRGFSTYEKSAYRNDPLWQLPIELKRRLPTLPILVDPSHICGHRDLKRVSQKAMDLNYDGLIIEVHHDPDNALSDAKQQITPFALAELIHGLKLRKVNADDEQFIHTLETLRQKIDKYDEELLDLLEQRMEVSKTIGLYKKQNNVTILQPSRWDEIITKIRQKGAERNLSTDLIDRMFTAIHQESINKQMAVMNNGVTLPSTNQGKSDDNH
ncbi:MAG: bifunctional 3-deoxy-7-phosphoheptulonate synthase/chorismate mutase type II [Bacteroidales bacterium]|nr:bifunctional 3-deoxy-7-phosphoheptulonate synthase/chorismate mutase type II [Bacteroidales bacterium]